MFGRHRHCHDRARSARLHRFRPQVEVLEDRLAPATVTNLLDNGSPGSLRAVIASAESGDTIDFAVTGTIQLTQGPLVINNPELNITGPGAGQLTISGGGVAGVFVVSTAAYLSISGLTIANGLAVDGGGIDNQGQLLVEGCSFVGNRAGADGGAIFENGSGLFSDLFEGDNLQVSNSSFSNNSAGLAGGAIYDAGTGQFTSASINFSSFTGNSAPSGGAIFDSAPIGFDATDVNLYGDTFTQNTPDNGMGGIDSSSSGLISAFGVLITKGTPFTASAGVGFTNQEVAQFTVLSGDGDDGNGDLAATISWGDGTEASDATIVSDGSSDGYLVLGTHAYQTDATYTIQVSLQEIEIASTSITSAAVVLTPSQSAQLDSSAIATTQAGSPLVAATATGISALLTGSGADATNPSTLFVGSYTGNPTGVSSSGLVFYDARVTNVGNGSLLVSFRYPTGDLDPALLYFSTATQSFQPVQTTALVNDTVHHVLIAVIDGASVPTLASLGHTVFTIGVAVPAGPGSAPAAGPNPASVAPVLASAGSALATPPTVATFTSSTQLSLTLTPLQQSQFAFSQAASPTGGGDGTGDNPNLSFRWAWDLLGLDEIWRALAVPIDRSTPTQGPAAGTEEDSGQNDAGPGDGDWSRAEPRHHEDLLPIGGRTTAVFPCSAAAGFRATLGLFFAGAALLPVRRQRRTA